MSKSGEVKRHGFSPSDCKEDDDRIAYLVLNAGPDAFSDIGDIPEAEYLSKLYEEIIAEDGYIRFIVTSIADSRVEKQSVLPTTGDSFAATFSGADPQVLTVQGYLVHEYRYDSGDSDAENVSDSMRTWYVDFMYLYEYYLRASRLAKWKSTITLNLPDFGSYDGYMLSINTSQQAETDITVPFTFQMLVVNRSGIKLSRADSILTSGSGLPKWRNMRDDLGGTSRVNGKRNNKNVSISSMGSVEIRPIPATAEITITPLNTTQYNPESAYSGLGIAGKPYATMGNIPPADPQVDMDDVAADQRLQSLYKMTQDTPDNYSALMRLKRAVDSGYNSLEDASRWFDRLKQLSNTTERGDWV